jgi:hypothetical protein
MRTVLPGQRELGRRPRVRPTWRVLPILAVLLSGCAQPSTSTLVGGPAVASGPATTIVVGPDDDGRTYHLKVGERLVVELRPTSQPSRRSTWTLRPPPSTALKRLDRDSDPRRVTFLAQAAGTVQLVLLKPRGCQPPLRCPLADPSGMSQGIHPPLPAQVVTIIIQVQ